MCVAIAVCALGCGSSGEVSGEPMARGSGEALELGSRVVAVVDGEPIELSAVQTVVDRDRVSAEEAVGRIRDFLLVVHEAERRGFERQRAVRRAESRALVQLVLRDLEDRTSAEHAESAVRARQQAFAEQVEALRARTQVVVVQSALDGAFEGREAGE